jgi:hypothetical protein
MEQQDQQYENVDDIAYGQILTQIMSLLSETPVALKIQTNTGIQIITCKLQINGSHDDLFFDAYDLSTNKLHSGFDLFYLENTDMIPLFQKYNSFNGDDIFMSFEKYSISKKDFLNLESIKALYDRLKTRHAQFINSCGLSFKKTKNGQIDLFGCEYFNKYDGYHYLNNEMIAKIENTYCELSHSISHLQIDDLIVLLETSNCSMLAITNILNKYKHDKDFGKLIKYVLSKRSNLLKENDPNYYMLSMLLNYYVCNDDTDMMLKHISQNPTSYCIAEFINGKLETRNFVKELLNNYCSNHKVFAKILFFIKWLHENNIPLEYFDDNSLSVLYRDNLPMNEIGKNMDELYTHMITHRSFSSITQITLYKLIADKINKDSFNYNFFHDNYQTIYESWQKLEKEGYIGRIPFFRNLVKILNKYELSDEIETLKDYLKTRDELANIFNVIDWEDNININEPDLQ